MRKAIQAVALLLFSLTASAQGTGDEKTALTKIEKFERQTGSVVIRGFSKLGTVPGLYGGHVLVKAVELTNATTGAKERGVIVEVEERSGRDRRAYVDYDEIQPLLQGIDYISKVTKAVTTLLHFQADYVTKGELQISTFSTSDGPIEASVRVGDVASASAFLSLGDLQAVKSFITQAKEKLDSARQTPSPQ